MEDTSWSTRHSCLLYFIEFATVTQHGDRGWNRTDFPIDINPFITHPAHERLYHITWVYAPTLYERQCGFSYVPQESEHWKSCEKGPCEHHVLRNNETFPEGVRLKQVLIVVITCILLLVTPSFFITRGSNYQQIFISNSWFRSGRRSKVGWNKVRCCEGKNIFF